MSAIGPGLILLHVAQPAVRAAAIDHRMLAAGALLFGVLVGATWRGSLAGVLCALRRRRVRSRATSLLISAFVFMAVLPAVLPAAIPYDHLFERDAHAASETAQAAVHSSHCHLTPATCSDAPVTSGLGQLLTAGPLVIVPAMLSVLVALASTALVGISIAPDTRPPRFAPRLQF